MIRALVAILLWGLPVRPPLPGSGDLIDRLAALERCQQGFADLGKASTPSAAGLMRACADIFREPACAAAMRDPPSDPAEFASTITRACRQAYCPKLPAPRPQLCAAGDLPPPTELLGKWGELQQHIWAFELGVEPKVMAPLFRPIVVSVRDLPPIQRKPVTTVVVHAKPDGAGRVKIWMTNGRSIVVPENAADDNPAVAALARDARTRVHAGEDAELLLRGDKQVLFSVITVIMSAFQKEGFHKVAIMTEPEPAPSP